MGTQSAQGANRSSLFDNQAVCFALQRSDAYCVDSQTTFQASLTTRPERWDSGCELGLARLLDASYSDPAWFRLRPHTRVLGKQQGAWPGRQRACRPSVALGGWAWRENGWPILTSPPQTSGWNSRGWPMSPQHGPWRSPNKILSREGDHRLTLGEAIVST